MQANDQNVNWLPNKFFPCKAMFDNLIGFSMTKFTQNSISHVCFGSKNFQQYQEHNQIQL
jgi:hypothetical protein